MNSPYFPKQPRVSAFSHALVANLVKYPWFFFCYFLKFPWWTQNDRKLEGVQPKLFPKNWNLAHFLFLLFIIFWNTLFLLGPKIPGGSWFRRDQVFPPSFDLFMKPLHLTKVNNQPRENNSSSYEKIKCSLRNIAAKFIQTWIHVYEWTFS